MLRSLQMLVPAIAFLGAVGIATVALTMDVKPEAVSPPTIAAAIAPIEAPPQPKSILDTSPAAPPAPRPTGVLTYITGEGDTIAGDLTTRLELIEAATGGSTGSGSVYPSPDGRYVASIRSDALGTWIDVSEDDRKVVSFTVAGPDDPRAVAGGKGLAAAVDGVPLTIAWSPDSRYLAYGSMTGAPYALSVARADNWSTNYRQVAGGYVGELAWAPDSSRLAISTYEIDRSDHTVLIYNPTTTVVRHLIDGCAIVWAPDAAFLAIHREPNVATGVWITSPDGEIRIEATADEFAFPIGWAERNS